MAAFDAVDGARSAASECQRVVALTQSGHQQFCGWLALLSLPEAPQAEFATSVSSGTRLLS